MNNVKPDKPHILVEFYYGGPTAVVSVNQLAGIVFLPTVAGTFFGANAHDRADQLAFHIASVSGLDIVKVFHTNSNYRLDKNGTLDMLGKQVVGPKHEFCPTCGADVNYGQLCICSPTFKSE